MRYFGTNTREAGHYYWDLSKGMARVGLRAGDLPFNPEGLFSSYAQKGTTCYAQCGSYTIFGICGSPIDKRNGCKSVFFVEGTLTREEMVESIKKYPAAQEIISKMPFEIKW